MIPRHHNLARARNLRHEPTEAERVLWKRLRHRQMDDAKFRRQRPIGNFIVDFVCLEAMLVVEVDGSQHVERAGYDATRTLFLEAEGYEVMRIWNNDITTQPDGVMEAIYDALGRRLRLRRPPPSALRAPSPASD